MLVEVPVAADMAAEYTGQELLGQLLQMELEGQMQQQLVGQLQLQLEGQLEELMVLRLGARMHQDDLSLALPPHQARLARELDYPSLKRWREWPLLLSKHRVVTGEQDSEDLLCPCMASPKQHQRPYNLE